MFLPDSGSLFPPPEMAGEDGLLAIGGDLGTERLLMAYRNGIFPWYNEDEPICWWCPNPRFVLFPEELKISKSMKAVLNAGHFQFSVDTHFSEVIQNCKTINRKGQSGTWISPDMLKAYNRLHELGHAHSAETWLNDKLVGGLYGIKLGRVFFGESMFSAVKNASKFAFIKYLRQLQNEGLLLVDCQVYTRHLETMGARMIGREEFLQFMKQYTGE